MSSFRKSWDSLSVGTLASLVVGVGATLLLGALSPVFAAPAAAPELEPLVITAPRDRLPPDQVIDPQINMHLLRLLQQRLEARPSTEEEQNASVGNLNDLTTATGFKLKSRYTELGFLLTEGLAGVKDLQLANELQRAAKLGTNVAVRAAAMVALAYTKDQGYLTLFQSALLDRGMTVRLAAVESLLVLGGPGAQFPILNAAQSDISPVVRVYAGQGLWRSGDRYGREVLLRHYEDQDWLVRAMAVRYLGELGSGEDYRKLMIQLGRETHPVVKVELAGALLNLQKYKEN